MRRLLGLVADANLLAPPVNFLTLSLAPGGLAPHIVNLAAWRAHVLERLRQQVSVSGDPVLASLRSDLLRLPGPDAPAAGEHTDALGGVAVPFVLRTPAGILSLISTTTVFGTPVDVTLSELALETFFPADHATAEVLRAIDNTGKD